MNLKFTVAIFSPWILPPADSNKRPLCIARQRKRLVSHGMYTPDGMLVHPFSGQEVKSAIHNLALSYDEIRYPIYGDTDSDCDVDGTDIGHIIDCTVAHGLTDDLATVAQNFGKNTCQYRLSFRIPDQVEYRPDPEPPALWIPAFAEMTW